MATNCSFRGFGHAFVTLTPEAEIAYKCSDVYAPDCDGGILWSDPALAIDWPLPPTGPHFVGQGQKLAAFVSVRKLLHLRWKAARRFLTSNADGRRPMTSVSEWKISPRACLEDVPPGRRGTPYSPRNVRSTPRLSVQPDLGMSNRVQGQPHSRPTSAA